jgi:pseudouridine synthase
MLLIKAGDVKVNGRIITDPGFQVNDKYDQVYAQDKIIKLSPKVYIKLNKPAGVVTSLEDKFARYLASDILPPKFRSLHPVGRLDKDTEGLLLFTNDGDLTYRLTHPKFKIRKIYLVLVKGLFNPRKKRRLESGVMIDGMRTAPCEIKIISADRNRSKIKITLFEGKKRQIKKMFEKAGNPVIKLKRIQEAGLKLDDLKPGQWRFLARKEIEDLYRETGLKLYG